MGYLSSLKWDKKFFKVKETVWSNFFKKLKSVPFSLRGLVFQTAIRFQKQTQSLFNSNSRCLLCAAVSKWKKMPWALLAFTQKTSVRKEQFKNNNRKGKYRLWKCPKAVWLLQIMNLLIDFLWELEPHPHFLTNWQSEMEGI